VKLKVEADSTQNRADDNDLCFITIFIVDEKGIVKSMADRKVTVNVEGAGILQGLGSWNPKNEENYFNSIHNTFNGKALAVIRPIESRIIEVIVEAEGCTPQTVKIEVH
jgi:hypothetical protein